jgi:FtsZ-binding cell division protein ZapB
MSLIDPEINAQETDALGLLEERIQRAVALVTRLRQEKEAALTELAETQAAWEESQNANTRLTEELNAMHAEKSQVRERLEKLLSHIDTLGAA